MRKEINEKEVFERLLNIYLDDNFTRKSTYYDEELKKQFDYNKIIEYLEKYFRNNIVDEGKVLLFHEKRRNMVFHSSSILKYKRLFYKFINGEYNLINDALVYILRYASKEDLENYKKALTMYYEKFKIEFDNFEKSWFNDDSSNSVNEELPIMLLFREYVKYILKENYMSYKRKKSLAKSKSHRVFTKILQTDDMKTLANEIYGTELVSELDLNRVFDYIMTYKTAYEVTDKKLEKLEKVLMKKATELKKYLNLLHNNEKMEKAKENLEVYEKERLPLCNKLVEEYLNNDFNSMKMFCRIHDISYDNFKSDILIVKKYNIELYQKFAIKVKQQQTQRYAMLSNILEEVASKLMFGVEIENGEKREFDIIDYYLLTNINLDKLLIIAKNNLNGEPLRLVQKFVRKYHYGTHISRNVILKERNVIMLNGKLYEVTADDKNYVFDYLKTNNMPFLPAVYVVVLRRYLSNDLPLLVNKKLVIKK